MRKLLIAIGVVIVLVMASPFVVGIVAESRLRDRVESGNGGQFIALRVADYERGWLQSRARIELGLGDAYLGQIEAMTQQPQVADVLRSFVIPVIVEFTHGPILVGEISGIGFVGVKVHPDPQSQTIQLAEMSLGVPYLFEIRGKSQFGSGFHFTGDIPSFDGGLADVSYDFSGIDVTGVSTLDHLEFDAVLESASVQSPLLSAVLESFRMTGDYDLREGSFAPGRSEMTLGRVAAINPLLGAAPVFAAENLSIVTTTSESADRRWLDGEVVYRIGRVAAGPGFEISDAALGLRLAHIDSAALNGLVEAASSVQMSANPAALVAEILPHFDRIVAGSPELTIDPIRFALAGGDFDGRLQIGVDGGALPTGSVNDFMNPAVARQALTASADLRASKPLVEMLAKLIAVQGMPAMTGPDGGPLPPDQLSALVDAQVAQQIGQLTAFGLIRDDGDDLSCTVSLEGGELIANGQPVPLPF